MTYTAKSLEDIAQAFEHRAWQATAFADRLHKTQRDKLLGEREALTWRQAAQQIRETLLAPLEAIRQALDGEEWSPDTLDAIADAMRSVGYEIRDIGEEQ